MRFQFKPGLTLATAIAMGILLWLGTWQVQRLQWKLDLLSAIEAKQEAAPVPVEEALMAMGRGGDVEFMRVYIDGMPVGKGPAKIFGSNHGRVGYYIFTPYRTLGESETALNLFVNLGFVPEQNIAQLSSLSLGQRPQKITGTLRVYRPLPLFARWLAPKPDVARNIWYQRDIAAFNEALGVDSPLLWIDADEAPGATGQFAVAEKTYLDLPNNHLDYALTWYGLALVLLVIYLALSFSRASTSRASTSRASVGRDGDSD